MTIRIYKIEKLIPKTGSPVFQIWEELDSDGRLINLDPRNPTAEELQDADDAFAASQQAAISSLTVSRDELADRVAELEPMGAENELLRAELDALKNPPGPDLTTVAGVKAYLAAKRYAVETAGIDIEGQVVTTERDEIRHWFPRFYDAFMWLNNDATARAINPDGLYPYKPKQNDSVILPAAKIVRAYQCMAWYVNACFATEFSIEAQIKNGVPLADVVAAIDSTQTWPQRSFAWIPG